MPNVCLRRLSEIICVLPCSLIAPVSGKNIRNFAMRPEKDCIAEPLAPDMADEFNREFASVGARIATELKENSRNVVGVSPRAGATGGGGGAAGAAAPPVASRAPFYRICRNANLETKSNGHCMYLKSVRGPWSGREPRLVRGSWSARNSWSVRGPGPGRPEGPGPTKRQLSVRGPWSVRWPWSVRGP